MSERITPSLVISIIALVVALGGVSYAAIQIPKNSIGAKQLKNNSVNTAKLKKNAVVTAKLRKASVTTSRLKDGSVNSAKVKDGTLLRSDFEAGQINGDAWFSTRTSDTLFNVTGSFTPIVTTPVLPVGSYVLQGRANVLGGIGGLSTLICSMENDAAQNFTVPINGLVALSMSATAVLSEPRAIQLSCLRSSGSPQIAQAHVIVTQVNKVTGGE